MKFSSDNSSGVQEWAAYGPVPVALVHSPGTRSLFIPCFTHTSLSTHADIQPFTWALHVFFVLRVEFLWVTESKGNVNENK